MVLFVTGCACQRGTQQTVSGGKFIGVGLRNNGERFASDLPAIGRPVELLVATSNN